MSQTELRCVHCGWRAGRLVVQYSPVNIRLIKCVRILISDHGNSIGFVPLFCVLKFSFKLLIDIQERCELVADPYIECEFMVCVTKSLNNSPLHLYLSWSIVTNIIQLNYLTNYRINTVTNTYDIITALHTPPPSQIVVHLYNNLIIIQVSTSLSFMN